jgi:eukaryotic-like serine/threonine-protein kinase
MAPTSESLPWPAAGGVTETWASVVTSSVARAPDVPGALVAHRYVLLERLGQGGAGAVFAAHDSYLNRRVALKFLRNKRAQGYPGLWHERLLREAKAMARLSHANVVTLYDVCVSSQDDVFLAMELVEGGTLTSWLQERPRGWREVVAMLCDAGEGLAAAHRAGMIHRDFKPDNVLLGTDGRPRVTDFGLARSAQAIADDPLLANPSTPNDVGVGPNSLGQLTVSGAVMGTPGYMAPEQYSNPGGIDRRADIFAFCATLYRALYGVKPFEGETFEQISESTLEGQVCRPRKGIKVPAWVNSAVISGLATDREARPSSMEELLRVLRRRPAKHRWVVAATAVTALCGLAVGTRARVPYPATAVAAAPSGVVKEAPTGAPTAAVAAVKADARIVGPDSEPTTAAAPATKTPSMKAAGLRLGAVGTVATRATPSSSTSHTTSGCTVETIYDAEGLPYFKKTCK